MSTTRKFRGIEIDTDQEAYLVVDAVAEIMAEKPTEEEKDWDDDALMFKASDIALELIAS